ncbi:hypothetical protein CC86DRAFT_309902 [Ophiobolus disseminans]|uniref:ferric-chelate reductase (NADPH) n=1 Tax=Ophiobolus disseminans TaxID=1469910 RepID=A0A6A6ZB74_9PLEO|nr:hypothetical protein CC86DRAFT_309902 [Ophiobolus disseminans]
MPRIQAILACCVWIATYTHRNLLFLYRNFSWNRARTRVLVENIHDNLKVNVSLPRPWRIRPGQYAYLTMRSPGFFSIFQRHPFMIAASDSKQYNFEMRIQPAAGFTRRLLEGFSREARPHAFIEGPYGYGFNLQEYGTVVLFASGIGIAGHLLYIQELVQDCRRSTTKTRDLLLIWSVENEFQRDLVSQVMDDALREDDLPINLSTYDTSEPRASGKASRHIGGSSNLDRPGIIDVYMYGSYTFLNEQGNVVPQRRVGRRIAEIRGVPNIPEIINDVLNSRTGKIAICGKCLAPSIAAQ